MTSEDKERIKQILTEQIVSTIVDNTIKIVETMEQNIPDSVPLDMRKQFIDNFINSQISLMQNNVNLDMDKFREELIKNK